MAKPTESEIADLKAKFGDDLSLVTFDKKKGLHFVVRAPKPAEYERFMDRVSEDAKKRPMTLDEIGRTCAVFPEEKERLAVYLLKPGASTTLATQALVLAGLTEEDTEKL